MKNLLHILFFLSLFLIAAFPQDRIHTGEIPEEHVSKRILELLQSNAGDLQRLHYRDPLLFKSKSNDWQTAAGNLQRKFYEEEEFDTKDTRTTTNKTLLNNGFILVEIIWQTWNGSAWVNVNKFMYSHLPTGIEQIEGEVSTYSLSNNYPNPFNPTTTIKFQIPEMGFISLKIYGILGNEITTLVNEELQSGSYETEFSGEDLSSGIYFYMLQAGAFVETKKMLMIK